MNEQGVVFLRGHVSVFFTKTDYSYLEFLHTLMPLWSVRNSAAQATDLVNGRKWKRKHSHKRKAEKDKLLAKRSTRKQKLKLHPVHK